jgi:hypothetical protein
MQPPPQVAHDEYEGVVKDVEERERPTLQYQQHGVQQLVELGHVVHVGPREKVPGVSRGWSSGGLGIGVWVWGLGFGV